MEAKTISRAPEQTAKRINKRIQFRTECNISHYVSASREEIEERLQELEWEWDIERTLVANAATFSLAGLVLGRFGSRKWFALPAVVSGFLFQHALTGWCPPVSIFRRLGVRTMTEIDAERYALKVLRGDFLEVSGEGARGILRAVSR